MMEFEELCSLLSEYFEGELDLRICEQIDRQLDESPCCEYVFNTFMKTVELCRQEEVEEVPEDVHWELIRLVEVEFKRSFGDL